MIKEKVENKYEEKDKDGIFKYKDGKHIEVIKGRKRVFTVNNSASMTDQSMAKDTDVNVIISRYAKTGQLVHLAKQEGVYADVSDVQDLHASMMVLEKAKEDFLLVPAHIRKKFDNDPLKMIAFLNDPKNDKEAIKLGLKVGLKSGTTTPDPDNKKPTKSLDSGVKTPEVKGEEGTTKTT